MTETLALPVVDDDLATRLRERMAEVESTLAAEVVSEAGSSPRRRGT